MCTPAGPGEQPLRAPLSLLLPVHRSELPRVLELRPPSLDFAADAAGRFNGHRCRRSTRCDARVRMHLFPHRKSPHIPLLLAPPNATAALLVAGDAPAAPEPSHQHRWMRVSTLAQTSLRTGRATPCSRFSAVPERVAVEYGRRRQLRRRFRRCRRGRPGATPRVAASGPHGPQLTGLAQSTADWAAQYH